jgi:DNA-binding transcriptional LysR family regulator
MKFLPLVLFVLALAACVAPAPQARIRISTGERLLVNLRDGRVDGAENKFVKVLGARFMVSAKAKNGIYDLGLNFAAGVEPTSIRVEDVTDEKAHLLLQDDAPTIEKGIWHKTTDPVDLNAPSMQWMHEIDDSFRVYAFHITLKDGQKITLHQASIYLGFFKAGMMQILAPDKNAP